MIRVDVVTTTEHLVTVTGRVEEVDSLAVGQAVTSRADIDGGISHGDQVRGAQYVFPSLQEERGVMELALLLVVNEGNVVLLHGHGQELGNTSAVAIQNLLCEMEPKHVHEDVVHRRQFRPVKQTVIKPNGLHTVQATGPCFRVNVIDAPFAGVELVGIEFEGVTGRHGKTNPAATVFQVTLGDLLDSHAKVHQVFLKLNQRRLIDHLEAHEVTARFVRFAQDHRELVHFGPGL